jgi:DNA-binding NarL/FixJ family response regulator
LRRLLLRQLLQQLFPDADAYFFTDQRQPIRQRLRQALMTVDAAVAGRLERLTDREREVVVAVAGGSSNAEIAGELFIGPATVKSHVSSILTKLGLRDRTQLVVFAYESGLVEAGTRDIGH